MNLARNSKFWADPFIHFTRQRGDPLQYTTKFSWSQDGEELPHACCCRIFSTTNRAVKGEGFRFAEATVKMVRPL